MRRMCLVLAMCVLAPWTAGADLALPSTGTRIRLQTGTPPWTEEGGVRRLPGRALREDEDSVTFQPLGEDEPTTRTKKGRWLKGWVAGADESHLLVRLSKHGEILKIPAAAVSQIEVSKGPRRLKSTLVGAGVGAAGLAALCALPEPEFGSRRDWAIMGAMAGTLFGAIVGAAIGEDEGWWPVVPPGMHVRVGPTPGGGAGASIAIGF
jgi:hypothetical protein